MAKAVNTESSATRRDLLASTLADDECRDKLHEALRELPDQMRQCVLLRYQEQLKDREIAGVMQIPIGTVKSRILRATERLRVFLESDLPIDDDTGGGQEREDCFSRVQSRLEREDLFSRLQSWLEGYSWADSEAAAHLEAIKVQLSRIESIAERSLTGDIESAIRLIEKTKNDLAGNVRSHESLIQDLAGQLLGKGLIGEAMVAWRDHRPDGVAAQAVHGQLLESLRQGWTTRNLWTLAVEPLIFHRDILVKITPEDQAYVCNIGGIELSRRGDTPLAALTNAVNATRKEVSELHGQLTHTLSEDGRARKRVLLGLIDLAASGLIRRSEDHTWVFGYLGQAEGGELMFKSIGGNGATSYSLTAALKEELAADGRLRFARVRTGRAGEPLGPVDEIEEPVEMDREAAWQEWERRTGGDVQ